jgi:hypothetical protein
MTILEHAEFFFMTSSPSSLAVQSETCSEGLCREIDHPPQLA